MKTLREIKWEAGRWIDFDYPGYAIREEDGTIVATNLMISEEDAKMLKAKIKAEFPAWRRRNTN
jgi:hypothetical protein